MIKYSVLASGSTGNSVYIGTEEQNIIIDAGLSGKQLEARLQNIGINIKDLDAIFITHEHDDHIKGVGVLARKYNIPIFANGNTLDNLPNSVGKIDHSLINIMQTDTKKNFGTFEIESFAISHDAAEPVGYIIKQEDIKLSIVTDLGYVSQKIKNKIVGSDAFVFEANHDVEMLRMSSYPWSIKKRILSDVGHLSNEASGEALTEIITDQTQIVHLAHLSRENNLMELARLSVRNIFSEYGITEKNLRLMDTYPDKPTKLEIVQKKSGLVPEIEPLKMSFS